jgi:YVTN family beta-propeller protein
MDSRVRSRWCGPVSARQRALCVLLAALLLPAIGATSSPRVPTRAPSPPATGVHASAVEAMLGIPGAGPVAPTVDREGVPSPAVNLSPIGSPAYTWSLSNGTAVPGLQRTQNGSTPGDLAVDGATGTLWVGYNASTHGVSPDIQLVNLSESRVIGEIPNTPNATAILFDPSSDRMYVSEDANTSYGLLQVLNASTDRALVPPIRVGAGPDALVIDPSSSEIFVGDSIAGEVSVVSIANFSARNVSLPVGALGVGGPSSLTYDPVNGDVYALCSGAPPFVFVLNGSTGEFAAPAIPGAYSNTLATNILFDPADGRIFALLRNVSFGSFLEIIDPRVQTAIGTVPIWASFGNGVYANSMVLDPRNGDLYFVGARWWESQAEGDLGILYPLNGTIRWTSGYLGPAATYQALDPVTGVDYVAHEGQTYLSAISVTNLSTNVPLVELGGSPYSGTYDPLDGLVYVPESYWDADPVDRGSLPNALLALPPSASSTAGTVPIGAAPSSLAGFPAGLGPVSVAYAPGSGHLFVANYGASNATILNATSGEVVGFAPLALAPVYDVADPRGGTVYFANPLGAEGIYASNGSVAARYSLKYPCYFFPPGPIEDLAVNPSNGTVYYFPAADGCAPNVGMVVWDPTTGATSSVNTNAYPYWSAATFDPADGDLYIADTFHGLVDVVNASSYATVASIPVGISPVFVAYDPVGSLVLVANEGSDNLTILNGTSAAAGLTGHQSVPAGNGPSEITVVAPLDEVFVSDAAGGSIVQFSTRPVISGVSSTPSTVDVGTLTTLSVRASGGSGALHYAYSGLPTGCSTADQATLPCLPTASGSWTVSVRVTDSVGVAVQASLLLVVNAAPTLALAGTPSALDGSGTVQFGAIVTGGTGPFDVNWTFGDGSTGFGLGTSHTYEDPGHYTVLAMLRDAAGGSARANTPITVGASLSVLGVGATSRSAVGSPLTWTATVSGGVGPYVFNWSFGDGTELTTGATVLAGQNESPVEHTYSAPGSYAVSLKVSDAGGESTRQNWTVTIGAAPPPAHPPPPFPTVLVALGAADGLAALAVIVLALRRRARATAPAPK